MLTIQQINVHSAGKILGMIYMLVFAFVGLLRLFAFVFMNSLPTFPIYYSTGVPEEMSIEVAIINYLLGIALAFASGMVAGVVLAFIYNLIAPRIGGLEVQVK